MKRQAKLPAIESDEMKTDTPTKNPFKAPIDDLLFQDKETIRVHTLNSLTNNQFNIHQKFLNEPLAKRQTFRQLLAEEKDDVEFFQSLKQKELEKVLITKQSKAERALDKERLTDFVNKKREMFLIQYALNVKKDEMRKLEEMALVLN